MVFDKYLKKGRIEEAKGLVGGIGEDIAEGIKVGLAERREYRRDEDLEILAAADNNDLQILVEYLTKDENGEKRINEELTSLDKYKSDPNNPRNYWQEIARELQLYGSNTLVAAFRGKGVPYRKILCDVCDKMKVNYSKASDIGVMELNLLEKILTDAIEKMSDEGLKEFVNMLNLNVDSYSLTSVIGTIRTEIMKGGEFALEISRMLAYETAQSTLPTSTIPTLATVGALAGGFAISRGIASFLAGPIGVALATVWTAVDAAGPAYRITVPCVIQIAYIRIKSQHQNNNR